MGEKKWKKISEELDYERPFIKMTKETFVAPYGKNEVFYKIKKDDFVVILPMDGDHVFLVDTYRWAVDKKSLELSAGFIEKGETPLLAAKREMKEETGISAKKFTYLGWYYVWMGMSDIKGHAFLAENLRFGKQELELDEYGMKLKKIKLADVGGLIKKNKIVNGTTFNAFYLYSLFLNNKKQNKKF